MRYLQAVLCLLAVQGFAYAAAPEPGVGGAEADAAYRATGNLARLAVMRVAVEDAGFSDDVRDEALRVMDRTREAIIKLVKSESASAKEPAERELKMRVARDAFSKDIRAVLAARTAVRGILSDEQKSTWNAQLEERLRKADAKLLQGTIRAAPAPRKPAPPVDETRE